jgi:hypothetical protein
VLDEIATKYAAAEKQVRTEKEKIGRLGDWRQTIAFRWDGWLYFHREAWQVGSPSAVSDQEVFVLVNVRGQTAPDFRLIGGLSEGLLGAPADAGILKSGRPVFIRENP